MPLQLKKNEIDVVKKILRLFLSEDIDYRAFGSRAKNTARQYSDLDIVLISKESIPLNIISHLKEAFAESDLPFMVDIVDWQLITPDFREKIKQEWQVL